MLNCKQCEEILTSETCFNCGLVNDNCEISNTSLFTEFTECNLKSMRKIENGGKFSKVLKMQEWDNYTTKEKYDYKLSNYIKELCKQLEIFNNEIIEQIIELVSNVMYANKDNYEGSKRAKVKDGIIIMCIYYIYKNSQSNETISYMDLGKKINLHTKYLSTADKLIMELISNKKLVIDFNINSLEKPMDYVNSIIFKYKLQINDKILDKVNLLINICEDNDIILNRNPLSIGTSCLYYILCLHKIEIDLKVLAKIYNISIVTITKTFNKLNSISDKLEKLGISI
jgi:transcription initiation factor TFIIIB Brf1 subunit/transcription initiation factor TFIIB